MDTSTDLFRASNTRKFELEKYNKIRDMVAAWYECNCLEDEIEDFDFDLSVNEGRLKVIVLGIFFNCIFQETKALTLFKEMEKAGYLTYQELPNFEINLKSVMKRLALSTGKSWKVLKIQNMIDSVSVLHLIMEQDGDIDKVIKARGIDYFVRYLYGRLSGVKAKFLWICRECKDYYDIPNAYCYIPDSHVNKFLVNIGFLDEYKIFSLEECLQISKRMSVLLDNQYFDLPYMRYHQARCKRCEANVKQTCKIDCRFTNKK